MITLEMGDRELNIDFWTATLRKLVVERSFSAVALVLSGIRPLG